MDTLLEPLVEEEKLMFSEHPTPSSKQTEDDFPSLQEFIQLSRKLILSMRNEIFLRNHHGDIMVNLLRERAVTIPKRLVSKIKKMREEEESKMIESNSLVEPSQKKLLEMGFTSHESLPPVFEWGRHRTQELEDFIQDLYRCSLRHSKIFGKFIKSSFHFQSSSLSF